MSEQQKTLKLFKILLSSFSFIALTGCAALPLLSGCKVAKDAPDVEVCAGNPTEVCTSDPKAGGFQCMLGSAVRFIPYDLSEGMEVVYGGFNCRPKNNGALYTRKFKETEDLIGLPYNDFEAMLNYCKQKKAK